VASKRHRRARARLSVVVLAGVLAAVASGCATVPTGGAPQPLEGQGGQQQAFVQPLPPPGPKSWWSPEDVTLGFVQASANFELDPAAAKRFLAPGVQWDPLGKDAAGTTIVSPTGFRAMPLASRLQGGDVSVTYVTVTGQALASLTSTGQYRYQPGSPTYTFGLEKSAAGVWLIQSLPAGDPLLLTQAAFEQVFQPRNLYFFGPAGTPAGNLVPDPVFAPVQGSSSANTTALATGLVNGLILDQHNWLSGATTNAFPVGTTLLGVTINNLTAQVDLGMSAAIVANLTAADIAQMYEQLRQTLTTSSYSPRVASSVQLAINNKMSRVSRSQMTAVVPPVGLRTASLYFAGDGTVNVLRPSGPTPVVTAGPAQLDDQVGVRAVAISWAKRPQLALAVPDGTGCAVLVGTTGSSSAYRRYRLPARTGACTSLSWDEGGDLWAVAGSRIWILRAAGPSSTRLTGPMQVAAPSGAPSGARVLALRMAPDGVRAAMLVHTKDGNSLLMAAAGYGPDSVTFGPAVPVGSAPGSDLADPVAVTWYSPDQLVAISQGELYQVPLTGGAPLPLGAPPVGADSITSNGYVLAVGTSAGRVYTSPGPDSPWTLVASGSAPAYPG
jgi:hypothetical protein